LGPGTTTGQQPRRISTCLKKTSDPTDLLPSEGFPLSCATFELKVQIVGWQSDYIRGQSLKEGKALPERTSWYHFAWNPNKLKYIFVVKERSEESQVFLILSLWTVPAYGKALLGLS